MTEDIKVDKQTLKSTIVELKNNNKTFQEISDTLSTNYGVKMSRQAVCGMYNRTISSKQMTKNIDMLIATSDIANYSALGLSGRYIKDIINNNGIELSLYSIESKIKEESSHINGIKIDLLKKTIEMIKKGMDIGYIVDALSYKGVKPTNKVLNELIEKASTEILKSRAIDLMVKLINITDNKELAKKIANKHNFEVTGKEISEALNR